MEHILIISGSLRKESWNTKIANEFAKLIAGRDMRASMANISTLPLFNQDKEANMPSAVMEFKNEVTNASHIIIVTPEHNRTIPSALKNAIDWASRPYGASAWTKKPILLAGATPGSVGTAVAQADLCHIFHFLDARVVGQPEIYITNVPSRFDNHGALLSETATILNSGIDALLEMK